MVIVHRRRSLALYIPASLRKREQEETHRGLTTHSGPSRENTGNRFLASDALIFCSHRVKANFFRCHMTVVADPASGAKPRNVSDAQLVAGKQESAVTSNAAALQSNPTIRTLVRRSRHSPASLSSFAWPYVPCSSPRFSIAIISTHF
jgi:hypothetical protein